MQKDKEGFLAVLVHSYENQIDYGCPAESRLEFLADHIFDFTTYDSAAGAFFGRKAVEVCAAISDRRTFEYIKNPDDYLWYLALCNMPFFSARINWGGSIRGAWWDEIPPLDTCALMEDHEQMLLIEFAGDEWAHFVEAIRVFAQPEMEKNHDAN